MTKKIALLKAVFADEGLVRIPRGWMCISQTKAYIANVVSEPYNYTDPDEFRTHPHDNNIPYDWARKDG